VTGKQESGQRQGLCMGSIIYYIYQEYRKKKRKIRERLHPDTEPGKTAEEPVADQHGKQEE